MTNVSDQKKLMETTMETQKQRIAKLESKVRVCSDEINNGNRIIEKYEQDLKAQRSKIKLKNGIVLKQEALI